MYILILLLLLACFEGVLFTKLAHMTFYGMAGARAGRVNQFQPARTCAGRPQNLVDFETGGPSEILGVGGSYFTVPV